ncbi:hypothetical protein RDABS01_025673, partial [Bienertia sinuspersici]
MESSKQKFGGQQKIPLGFWLKNWTIKHNLSEIPFKGANHTKTNNREGEKLIQERLDRAYGNTEWKNSHTNAIVWNFPIFLSDHGHSARHKPFGQKWLYWRQRAKSKLDDWGDKSTSFFFKTVKTRMVKNEIRAIKNENDRWKDQDQEIKNIFHKPPNPNPDGG